MFHIKHPQMTLPCSRDNDKDPFAFKNFLAHFHNSVGSNVSISEEQKIIYLRGALEGRAFQLVQSLSVSAENYVTAMDLMRGEFFLLETLVDRTREQMESALPISMPDYSGIHSLLTIFHSNILDGPT
jgi:hypothetical protein